ncbi:probable serine/threonine-protein kinase PIX13 [Rhododendron vialii]|uniref:probable serine/threonine-protein kinase PIX13 n=1 Tax=Rhododendron vialii TaxID=182163 RepID=UPI00265FDAC9|nr:probable serine/threonine-protein kinase PIX13 [Rhododendron vialii]
MGNCLGFQSAGSNLSASPSTSGKAGSYAKGGRFSASGSSASQGRSSFATSEDTCIDGEILPTSNLKAFSFGDMKSATGNFRNSTVLGQGGFGTVYKGFVDEKTLAPTKFGSGMIVAIKKLNPESIQGFQEWQSEVNFLGRLCHPNLVKLLGYCWEDQELLLVYEFMQKGSLENHLFGRVSSIEPLSWDIRLKIAIDAAKGLAFLHSPDVKVIYRDFKASNILLDGHYNAKISDFGIAKAGPSGGDSHVTTRIIGTHGYAAPEYVATGHLYVKSDVYGFGVVLLELLTGLRALDMKRAGKHNLVDWARPLLPYKSKLNLLMDVHIEGQYSSKAASLAANLTLRCLESDPKRRPSMKEVVEVLDRIVAIQGKSKSPSKSISSTSHHHHHHHHGHGREHGHEHGSQSSHHRSPLHPSQQH